MNEKPFLNKANSLRMEIGLVLIGSNSVVNGWIVCFVINMVSITQRGGVAYSIETRLQRCQRVILFLTVLQNKTSNKLPY